MKMDSRSTQDTKDLAKEILQKFTREKKPLIIALVGDLGTGKTTFTQFIGKELGIKKRILSPTFLIMKRFPLNNQNFDNLYHIDAYRINSKDLNSLGIQEAMIGRNIVLIEWADRVRSILPKDTVWVRFKHGQKENERQITINRR